MSLPYKINLGAGISIGTGISLGASTGITPPTTPTLGIWTFDPDYIGNNLFLTNSNTHVEASNSETGLALGFLDGNGSLYDVGSKVMYTIKHIEEDPDDIGLNLARIGFAYQYVDLNTELGDDSSGYGIGWCQDGTVHYANNPTQSGLPTFVPGDYLDIAVDLDAGKFWVRVNGGAWNGDNAADPATNTNGINLQLPGNGAAGTGSALYPAVNPGAQNYIDSMDVWRYTYSIPSGFTAI